MIDKEGQKMRRKKKAKDDDDARAKSKLHEYVDRMDAYQVELVLSFIKTLFGL